MTKTIFLIDPASGVLQGESVHPLDPVQTEREGKPVYALLNPELATETAPPKAPQGKQAVFAFGAWTLQPIPVPESEVPKPEVAVPELTSPTIEQRASALKTHVQEYMDAMARALGYDDIKTAVTYAEEPSILKFQNEGKALRAWRSRVWATCYELLEAVMAGTAAEPTPEQLADLLPKLEIPPLLSPEVPA